MRFGARRHLHRADSFLADAASQDAQKYAEPDNDDAAPVAEPESSSAFDFFSSRTPNASSTSRRVSFAGSVTGGNVAASRRAGCAHDSDGCGISTTAGVTVQMKQTSSSSSRLALRRKRASSRHSLPERSTEATVRVVRLAATF